MAKVIGERTLNIAIEKACDLGRSAYGWTDEQCSNFAVNLMNNLAREGFQIKKD